MRVLSGGLASNSLMTTWHIYTGSIILMIQITQADVRLVMLWNDGCTRMDGEKREMEC